MARLFGLLTILAGLCGVVGSANGAASGPSSDRHKLTVALYPLIPAFTEYRYQVMTGFAATPAGQSVDLDLPDLSDGYYDPGSPHFIESAQADVYEVDSIFLRDFAPARVQSLPKELTPAPQEFLPNAQRVANIEGTWYGVPHWVCGNLLFFESQDSQLAHVHTLGELTTVIAPNHPVGKGLLVDLKGKSTLGEFYLMALMDKYQDAGVALAHLSPFDPSIEADLKAVGAVCDVGFCRSSAYHNAEGFYPAQFARHRGRAMIGYSESLYYLLRESRNACVEKECYTDGDLAVTNVPLDDKGVSPMSWVDLFVISKRCAGQCLHDAIAFIRYVNSQSALLQHLTGDPPRYLLPARASMYTQASLLQKAPLYAKILPLVQDSATPTGAKLGPTLREYGARLDGDIGGGK